MYNFILAIFAGMMIAIGGIANLTLGGIPGAIFFSVGLLSILTFKFYLFTGKAGLLSSNGISLFQLIITWLGNFIGAIFIALLMRGAGKFALIDAADKIMQVRINNAWYQNIILGIMCGILMYIAVTSYGKYRENKNDFSDTVVVILCVAGFILCGFNHCVADMFYFSMSSKCFSGSAFLTVVYTTIGNLIGCNLIPIIIDSNHIFSHK